MDENNGHGKSDGNEEENRLKERHRMSDSERGGDWMHLGAEEGRERGKDARGKLMACWHLYITTGHLAPHD